MKDWKYIKTGNAFDFETQAVVDRKEAVKRAEEELRRAEAERNKHRGELYWEEAYITAKKDLERAKENLDRAKRQKTGNETIDPSDAELRKLEDELNGWLKMYDSKDPNVDKANIEKNIRAIRADIEKYKRKHKIVDNESIDKQEWSLYQGLKKDAEKEIGNEFATAPKTISIGDNVETLTGKKGNVVEKNGHILKIKLSDGSFEYEHEYKAKKVGNKTGNADTVSEYNAEIQRLTKKAEQLRRMGQGRSAMEIEKQIEKLGKELSELGNKKVGNAFDAGIHLTIRYNGKEEEVKVLKDMPTSVVVKGQNGAVVEIKKVDLDVLKVHNETKAEEKFGKVMGEYEEGALKTPQGKTVTDPAQAKAIAYSEADKVDNLKRARNAMNKKVKNSSVREYKDSEGRIAQIDFNSDGTDADMSIYEDERMTRSVESKNFSTIRDAEQYVQSHGFRRVG